MFLLLRITNKSNKDFFSVENSFVSFEEDALFAIILKLKGKSLKKSLELKNQGKRYSFNELRGKNVFVNLKFRNFFELFSNWTFFCLPYHSRPKKVNKLGSRRFGGRVVTNSNRRERSALILESETLTENNINNNNILKNRILFFIQ